MSIRSIKDIVNLSGRNLLLRTDFNVPIERGEIKDDYKIKQQLPTIKYLCDHGCKIVIVTHLGRPDKEKIKKLYSVRPIAKKLSELLGKEVKFIDGCVGREAEDEIKKAGRSEIVMLENIRFAEGEMENSEILAQKLAKLGELYVNDAFAVSHRAQASVNAIQNYLPSYAGLLLEEEIVNLNKALRPKEPLVVLIGGAKITTKIPLIRNLRQKAKYILVGGALANNFIAAQKLEVGKSLVDKESIKFAEGLVKDKKIILPIDVVVSDQRTGGKPKIRNIDQVDENEYIFDIGPQTTRQFAVLIKEAKTIIWNGPMGMFEERSFQHGTLSIARVVAARSTGYAFGVVGGGETVEALRMTKMFEFVDWVSTGGGAMLAYLGGEKMPGFTKIVS